jgi:hypothetical protein
MKIITLITLFLSTQLLANYAFSDEKTVKIDMHGGNSDSLMNNNGFSKMKKNGLHDLRSLSIKEPKEPNKPEEKTIPSLKEIELK